jgi:hypothetical protein
VENLAHGSKAGYIGYNGNKRDRCHRDECSTTSQNRAARNALPRRTEKRLGWRGLAAVFVADAREV